MYSTYGKALTLSLFGESHGPSVGCTITSLPAGITIDNTLIAHDMQRRAPGQHPWQSQRKEADQVKIISGLNANAQTCGSPLTLIIENGDVKDESYQHDLTVRPGHADFTSLTRYGTAADIRGGGHLSGRLTAPLVAAGALCKQVLAHHNINIAAHILAIGPETDEAFSAHSQSQLEHQIAQASQHADFTTIKTSAAENMKEVIAAALADKTSIGGIVECAALGLPQGLGEPLMWGLDSSIAQLAFAVPAVKGLEFGDGFSMAQSFGHRTNDMFMMDQSQIRTASNHAGGLLGGMTTGEPLVFRIAIKPTPSIAREQASVSFTSHTPTTLTITGRHDPCIVPRVVVVAEAICAIAVLDALELYHQTYGLV